MQNLKPFLHVLALSPLQPLEPVNDASLKVNEILSALDVKLGSNDQQGHAILVPSIAKDNAVLQVFSLDSLLRDICN